MRGTRKERAAELMRMLWQGPSLGFPGREITRDEAEAECRLWLRSWIMPEVRALVPELKDTIQ